ncbi:MAG TPA: MFS transporter, partial [Chitinophagaceae bacterium]|nr:MFS transporter [Chitinophagaceae bacterium]
MYNRTTVFITACLGLLLFGISLITLGSVAPDLKLKFHLDDLAAGGLFSILPIGILAGSVLFGPLTDRYGYKRMFIVSAILLAAGFAGIAYSESLVMLNIIIFIFGLSGGAMNGVTNAVVADISAEGKGAALSMLGVSFGVGALLMPLVLASLKSAGITFENILAGAGALSLVFGIFFLAIRFPKARQAQGFPLAKAGGLFKDSTLLLISFFLFFQSGLESIINNWTTTYLTKVNTQTLDDALYGLAFFVIGMTLMRLATGSVFRKIA